MNLYSLKHKGHGEIWGETNGFFNTNMVIILITTETCKNLQLHSFSQHLNNGKDKQDVTTTTRSSLSSYSYKIVQSSSNRKSEKLFFLFLSFLVSLLCVVLTGEAPTAAKNTSSRSKDTNHRRRLSP